MTRWCYGLLVAASALAPAASRADSAVWALRGTSNTIYLAGSVHALPTHDAALPATIENAYAQAEALIMEIDLDDLDETEAAKLMLARGMLPANQSLRSLLSAAQWAEVAKLSASLGLPIASLERLEPWAVALLLTQQALARAGFATELGVDQQLAARAERDRKPILGLETIEQQLAAFDAQSYEEQVNFLALSSSDTDSVGKELGAMIAAWRTADLDSLARELNDAFAGAPNLYRALIAARNHAWVPQILALRSAKEDYLVVVGALHLAGHDSVIRLLEAQGVTLERLP